MITFSPSGNTEMIGRMIQTKLKANHNTVQFINLAIDKTYMASHNKMIILNHLVKRHDILIIGSPVYAHHLQYHVKELIEMIPNAEGKWGEVVVPFVTYGGISSGIALEEAGKLLTKGKRKVLCGAKFSTSHKMTRAFMAEEYNKNIDFKLIDLTINALVEIITRTKCTSCGACVEACPVNHLVLNEQNTRGGVSIVDGQLSACIHCFNCISNCRNDAIHIDGDIERAKSFMQKKIDCKKEYPETCIYDGCTK